MGCCKSKQKCICCESVAVKPKPKEESPYKTKVKKRRSKCSRRSAKNKENVKKESSTMNSPEKDPKKEVINDNSKGTISDKGTRICELCPDAISSKKTTQNEILVLCPQRYLELLDHLSGKKVCGCETCKNLTIAKSPETANQNQKSKQTTTTKRSKRAKRVRAEIYSLKGGQVKWKILLQNTENNDVMVNHEVYDETPGRCVSAVSVSKYKQTSKKKRCSIKKKSSSVENTKKPSSSSMGESYETVSSQKNLCKCGRPNCVKTS